MKKWIILVVIVGLIAGTFFYLHKKTSVTTPTPTVTVTKKTIVSKVQAIGYIKPRHSSTVKSAVDGTVAAIYHDTGDYVKKGELLLTVKPQPDPADYATAYQTLQEATAVEKDAKKNLDRYIDALKTGLITKNYTDYISANKSYISSREQRILAQQKLSLLDKGATTVGAKKIGNAVFSPITGYILTRNVDVGDPVISISSAQSSTPLFTMANMSDLMFEGSVDEMGAAKIHMNMPASITIGATDKKITGIITKIGLQSEQENAKTGSDAPDSDLPFNVSFQIQITKLQVPEGFTLRSGYSATADIEVKKVIDAPTLPERVLHFKDNKIYVLLPAKEKDQKPIKQEVTLGLSDGINVEITSGVKVGEKVLDKPDTADVFS